MPISTEQVDQVRAFNRDYTRRIGVLSQGLLESPWSLTQVRVMYEIAHHTGVTAAELAGRPQPDHHHWHEHAICFPARTAGWS